jgi:hypothetical protein
MAADVTSLIRWGFGLAFLFALTACSSDSSSDDQGGAAGGDADIEPYPRPKYTLLSETGLYGDIAADEVASTAVQFEPSHQLWSEPCTSSNSGSARVRSTK